MCAVFTHPLVLDLQEVRRRNSVEAVERLTGTFTFTSSRENTEELRSSVSESS